MTTNTEYARQVLHTALSNVHTPDFQLFVSLYFPAFRGLSRDRSADISNEIFQRIFQETGTVHGTELVQWLDNPARGVNDFRCVLQNVLNSFEGQ